MNSSRREHSAKMTLETGTNTKLDRLTQQAVDEGRIEHKTNPHFKNSEK